MRTSPRAYLPALVEKLPQLAHSIQPLWHPLGFVSCVVEREESQRVIRLHYWPKNERRPKSPDWPIHTHVFDLSSLVLLGKVRDVQYKAVQGDRFAVYEVKYQGDDSEIVTTGQEISVEPVVDEVRNAGEEYQVPLGAFHQTIVPKDEEALTLVMCSEFGCAAPQVLGAAGQHSYAYHRAEFDKSVFWTRVREALRGIQLDQRSLSR